MKHLTPLAVLLALAVMPWAGGCVVNPATGKRQMILIPRDQEIAMGLEAAPKFEAEFGGRIPNPQLQQYIHDIGMKLAAVAERQVPYDFLAVNSDVPNAFALPGGKIFITAGLLSRLTNERQLAGVLGHEIGHVSALHNVQGMQQQMGAQILVELAGKIAGADKAEAAKMGTKVAASMATLKYSRTYEHEADTLGVRYLAKAGYNPYGMVEVLKVLHGLSKTEPGPLGAMFQTHPLTSARIAETEAEVRKAHPQADPDAPDPNIDRFGKMQALLRSP